MKRFCSLLLAVALIVCMGIPASAYGNEEAATQIGPIVLSVTDAETGVVQLIPATVNTISTQTRAAGEEAVTVEYSAFAPIEIPTSRSSESGGKTEGGVSVNFTVVYTINSDRSQIKVSRFYGSWTPSSNIFTISDRDVGVHAGLDSPGVLNRSPSSNSFDYMTGWGYCNFVPAGSGSPFAWADARVTVYGMSGSHLLTASLAFPESR